MPENPLEFGMVCVVTKLALCYIFQRVLFFCRVRRVCSDKEGKGIEAYGERWQIETLFGSLKSKGFNLEDTHMTAPAKIDRLMSVLAIGFVLSCRAGEAEDKRRPIKVKKHGRPAQSLFRAGLDRLVSVLSREMRLLEILGGEVMDLLAVKEDVG